MKRILTAIALFLSLSLYAQKGDYITPATTDKAISQLESRYGRNDRITRGVKHAAALWFEQDGSQEEFVDFVLKHYVADKDSLRNLAIDLSDRMRLISGYANKASKVFGFPFGADTGEITPVETLFGNFNSNVDLTKGYYDSKIAFLIGLNYPPYTDEEKERSGKDWTSEEWGIAQMGEAFRERAGAKKHTGKKVDEEFLKKMKPQEGSASMYSTNSTVCLASICDKNGNPLFEDDVQLLFHWTMRDYIKTLYDQKDPRKLEKQQAVYQAMTRYMDQTIPQQVLHSTGYLWNPYTNELKKDGKTVEPESAGDRRYGYIRNLFINRYKSEPDSAAYFDKAFSRYGIDAETAEEMFLQILSSPQIKQVGKLMKKKLGRKLQPFDTWYTGFNNRSNYETSVLDAKIKAMYPTPQSLQDDIPNILQKIGYTPEKARFLGERMQVDKTRANGHCMMPGLLGEKSHIRTNFQKDGLDFGGYQTFMHELGHAVQQVITTYITRIASMRGLPNTGVVESAAFISEFRTWKTLMDREDRKVQDNLVLDNFWVACEIAGPALWELRMWQWMYHTKVFTTQELKARSLAIAKEIWNDYYAPVYGCRNHIMPAVYNHTITSSLYLSGYAFAHMIHIQIEDYIEGKDYETEVMRIYGQGNKAAKEWMKRAVGAPLSAEPILRYTQRALDDLKRQ